METRRKTGKSIMAIMLTLAMCFSIFAGLPTNTQAASVSKVSKVKAASATCTSVKVTWNKAKNAKKYQVYLSQKSKSGFAKVNTTSSTESTLKGLTPDKKYYVKVRGLMTYNQKQYYHSKKKKWVTSKPSKKYIKDTRTVEKEKYGSYSSTVSFKTSGHSFKSESVPVTFATDGYSQDRCTKCGAVKNKVVEKKPEGKTSVTITAKQQYESASYNPVIQLSWDSIDRATGYKLEKKVNGKWSTLGYITSTFYNDVITEHTDSKTYPANLSTCVYKVTPYETVGDYTGYGNATEKTVYPRQALPKVATYENGTLSLDASSFSLPETEGIWCAKIGKEFVPIEDGRVDLPLAIDTSKRVIFPVERKSLDSSSYTEMSGAYNFVINIPKESIESVEAPTTGPKPLISPTQNIRYTSTCDTITLTWDKNPDAAIHEIRMNGGFEGRYRNEVTSWTNDYQLKPNTSYTFEVIAISAESERVSQTITARTTNIPEVSDVEVRVDYETIYISWMPTKYAKEYNVYEESLGWLGGTVTSKEEMQKLIFSDSRFIPGKTYTIIIVSQNGDNVTSGVRYKFTMPNPKEGFDEFENITLPYGNATIHLGQQWTSSLRSALGNDSIKVTRKNAIKRGSKIYNQDVYLYDTKDYDNFLAVYVVNNQITSWVTNGETFGYKDGEAFKRGEAKYGDFYRRTFLRPNTSDGDTGCYIPKNWNGTVEKNGVLIGGFDIYDGNKFKGNWTYDSVNSKESLANEKLVGFHFINAYRRLIIGTDSCEFFVYSKILDGEDKTWSGTAFGETLTNIRYGAQPTAETVAIGAAQGKKLSHNMNTYTDGPLAGQGTMIGASNCRCVDPKIFASRENLSLVNPGYATGEAVLTTFEGSSAHLSAFLLRNNIENSDLVLGIGLYTVDRDTAICTLTGVKEN